MASWLIYALGGGFGHLTRAAALARAAHPLAVRILTNSPYAACVREAMPELDLTIFDPAATIEEVRREVSRQVHSESTDRLIVDTFPRGLAGELVDILPSFSGPKILVQRDLNPDYAAAYDLTAFIQSSYDLALAPGDGSPGAWSQAVTTAPWLIRSQDELLTRDRARALLNLHDDKPCVIVCAAGNTSELDWYGAVASGLLHHAHCHVRCIAPACPRLCPPEYWLSYWPAIDLYVAAGVVIGGAGYNTIYECAACAVPLVARPWPRKYDRQKLRAERAAVNRTVVIVEDPESAVAAALEMLASNAGERDRPKFDNGVTEALQLIKRTAPNPLP